MPLLLLYEAKGFKQQVGRFNRQDRQLKKMAVTLKDLAYSNSDLDFSSPRGVSFYVPNDGEIIAPPASATVLKNLLVEDDHGILKKVKRRVDEWERDEYFVEYWRLEDKGLYTPMSTDDKRQYLEKNMLRYVDKRLSGEIKHAEKGTTLHKVGVVKESLRPQTKVQLSEHYRLRFRAKVLRGLMRMRLENPYIDEGLLEFKAFDKANFWSEESQIGQSTLLLRHRFGNNGPYSSYLEYGFYGESWKWEVQRELREVVPGLSIKFRTEQDNREYPWSGVSDKTGELSYGFTF